MEAVWRKCKTHSGQILRYKLLESQIGRKFSDRAELSIDMAGDTCIRVPCLCQQQLTQISLLPTKTSNKYSYLTLKSHFVFRQG